MSITKSIRQQIFKRDKNRCAYCLTTEENCERATVEALQMNNPTVVRARRRWASAGWHPPEM